MPKVVTIRQTPTGTVLRWVGTNQVLRFAGKFPEAWLQIIREQGCTIQQAA
jgi:hypothetical protein